MDDYLHWTAGTLLLGAYRVGPRRTFKVYACEMSRTSPRMIAHMNSLDPMLMDCMGDLVPQPNWAHLTEGQP